MARPKKCRKVCCLPENTFFGPLGVKGMVTDVVLFVDEYETIRLIDFEGLTQEECAEKMHIARTTVQGIYAEARKKIADCIVNGRRIVIEGGDYHLCNGNNGHCGQKHCRRRQWRECQSPGPGHGINHVPGGKTSHETSKENSYVNSCPDGK